MRIALDARQLARPCPRGIGKSLRRLYHGLAAAEPGWTFLAYVRAGEPLDEQALGFAQVRRVEMPGDRFDWWLRYRLPLAAWRDGADLLHCPANAYPAWSALPIVLTVHDLIPLERPCGMTREQVRRFEQSIRHGLSDAAAVVTPSTFTRHRLIEHFRVEGPSITAIHWGQDGGQDSLPAYLGEKQRLVLHFGSHEPRKNTPALLEAWRRIDTEGWRLRVLGMDEAGYVDDATARGLLASASVLAYPSLSEGFGLPILEAFAAGTAVLTGLTTSLPEVAGDAALGVDAHDVDAIASGLTRLLRDAALRDELVQRGRERLRLFTWDQTVARYACLFRSLVEARRGSSDAPRGRAA